MRPTIIGITGGIASGKSTVCQFLTHEGYTVISTDRMGHEVLDYPEIINKLKTLFGKEIIINGHVDRQMLRQIVFEDKDKIVQLNAVIHPEIFKHMDDIVDHYSGECIFFEVPLLFEAGMENCFDFIILISVDKDTQLKRLMKRNGFDQDEALNIINSQMDEVAKIHKSGLVIVNNGSEENLENQIWNFIKLMYQVKQRDLKRFSGEE